jgi:hypothetical protein
MTITDKTAEGTTGRSAGASLTMNALPLLALAITFIRCIRPPDAFAATQALFTCDVAPKRCAFGQALAVLHIPAGQFAVYSTLSFGLLLLAIGLAAMAAIRSGLARSGGGVVMLASLAASFGFGVFIALNGSLDVPMEILAVTAFLTRGRLQVAVITVAAIIGVMVHEAYLVIFLPVTLLPLLLRVNRMTDLTAPLTIGGVAFLIAVACALNRPLDSHATQRAFDLLQARADFPLQGYGLAVLRRSLGDNLAMMSELAKTSWFWNLQLANGILLAPVGCLFLSLVGLGWRISWPSKLLAVAAASSPLAMNLLGYDVLRWGGLCILTMALALCALAARYGPPRLASPLFPGLAAMFAVIPLLLPPAYSHQAGAPADVQAILQRT